MSNTVTFYTYPEGIADTMGQDEIVLVRNSLGSLDNKFVGDLVQGDYYCERIPSPLPPRSADDILEYMAKNGINMNYIKDEETHETVLIEAMKGNLVLCQMTFYDARTAIRDVIEPIMDMEEL
jgi:hypothetical protein